ncbi:MAG: Gfo/Idh/MocA family oxidoreductase, partial [Candidatus Omnitrophota bacterium]
MKIIFVGLGSIASRHIKNIKQIAPESKIAIWRQHSSNSDLGDLNNLVEAVFFSQSQACQWSPEAAFITNPASNHCQAALAFARVNSHLFIEKPLSDSLESVDELLAEVKQRKLTAMVGYMLRFHQPLRVVKEAIFQGKLGKILSVKASVGQNLLDWRPQKRYQDTVSAKKELGGGVLLELSHEIDYVRWLAGEIDNISAFSGKVGQLEVDVEDIAELNLKFKSGAMGNIHLDMLDMAANRSCRIIGEKATIKWESSSTSDELKIYSSKESGWQDLFSSNREDK